MAFIVKPVNGTAQRMELSDLHEALAQGAIEKNWLVRAERQDFWYSVGKLVGQTTSQPVTLFCPRCRSPIVARQIDIGLPAACKKCGTQVIVPDPLDAERRRRDAHLLAEVRQKTITSGLALAAGALVTGFSYFHRGQQGVWLFWWGPLAFGLGTFVVCFPQYLELKRKLRKVRTPDTNQHGNQAGR